MKRNKEIVLVVDDIEANLQAVGTTLVNNGYEVAFANNGKSALEVAQKVIPDLILLDLMMPDIDGYQVCKILKGLEATKHIPIIFLTSNRQTSNVVQGFNVGAVDYIIKPANQDETIVRIRTHLELKRSRELILEQNEKLKNLIEDKGEFLELASKDLKFPINNIRGLLDLIIHYGLDELPKEIADYIERIDQLTKNMATVVNDLLLMNDIETGNVRNIFKSLDISLIILKMIKTFENIAKLKRISIIYEDHLPEQIMVIADHDKLEEIFKHLIINALRYSKGKKTLKNAKTDKQLSEPWQLVTIKTRLIEFNSKEYVLVDIEDEGIGMPKSDLQVIFKKYAKITTNPTNEDLSSGLGLAIVKALLEAMNGFITIDSKENIGTTVKFALPAVAN